ncbi:Haloacid dehalogenase [Operophtera brumata]|uniref:Haloacid dehalogenase n=1 Tax=Operophtera brumata TaxID=104452 RepID=A0A0L7LH92_OPEBR|nr:Haloacid dehalogenase [Operophtera brumata]
MQAIKLVTFDATNTLLKFRIPPWQYYALVARDYGFTGSDDALEAQMKDSLKLMSKQHPNFGQSDVNWRCWWHKVVKLTFKNHLPASVDVDKIAMQLIDEFRTTKCWTVAYGSSKLLQLLKKNGVTIGVLSNFDPRLNDILCNNL